MAYAGQGGRKGRDRWKKREENPITMAITSGDGGKNFNH